MKFFRHYEKPQKVISILKYFSSGQRSNKYDSLNLLILKMKENPWFFKIIKWTAVVTTNKYIQIFSELFNKSPNQMFLWYLILLQTRVKLFKEIDFKIQWNFASLFESRKSGSFTFFIFIGSLRMARIKTINFLSLLSFVILSKVIHLLLHIGFFAEPNLIDDGNE